MRRLKLWKVKINNMTIHKKFVDQIITQCSVTLEDLIGKHGLNITKDMKNVDELPDQLDKIFYTLEFLRKEGLIAVKEINSNTKSSIFELPTGTSEEKIPRVLFYYKKLKQTHDWNIEMKPGLIHFKQQGYQTDNQQREETKKGFNKEIVEGVEIYARNIINDGMITSDRWYKKWWGQIIILVIGGLILAFFVYKFGWNK